MFEMQLHRITLDIAGLGEHLIAIHGDIENHARLAQGEVKIMLGQRNVQKLGATAVDHGGNLTTTTDPAGSALTKITTGGCGDVHVRHV